MKVRNKIIILSIIVITLVIVLFNIRSFYAEGETITFDLYYGDVVLNTSTYSGYDSNGNAISGTHNAANHYIVEQTDAFEADEVTPKTATTNRILIRQAGTYDVTLNGINVVKRNNSSTDVNNASILVLGTMANKNVTIRLNKKNKIFSLTYYTNASDNVHSKSKTDTGSILKITSAAGDGETSGILESSPTLDRFAGIGGTGSSSYVSGLHIDGGTIISTVRNISGEGCDSAIGGGSNGYAEVFISGGYVIAQADGNTATIGGGGGVTSSGAGADIYISGGTIEALNTGKGAVIGGGTSVRQAGYTAKINVSGGVINAVSSNGNAVGGGNSVDAVGGSASVNITGGTIKASNMGGGFSTTYGYADADIEITGGSINSSVSGQPTNGTANVYMTRATLYSMDVAIANQPISSIVGTGLTSSYGLNDVQTDESGTLYLWVPSGGLVTSANDGTNEYLGSVASKNVGVLQYNSSKNFYAIKVSYNKDVTLYTDSGLTNEFSGALMVPSNTNVSFYVQTHTYSNNNYYGVNLYKSNGTTMELLSPVESNASTGLYKYTVNVSSDNYIWIESNINGNSKKLSVDLSLGSALLEEGTGLNTTKVNVGGYSLDNYNGEFYLTSAGLGVTNTLLLKDGTATLTSNTLVFSSTESGITVESGTMNLYLSESNDSITSTNAPAINVLKGANLNIFDIPNGSLELETTKASTSAIGGEGNIRISKNGGFLTLTEGSGATDITAENYTFIAQKKLSNSALPYSITLANRTFVGYSSLYSNGSTYKMYASTTKHTTQDVGEEFKAIGVEYIKYNGESITPSISSNNLVFAVSNIPNDTTEVAHVKMGSQLLVQDTNYTWTQNSTSGTLTVNGNSITDHLIVAIIEENELAIVIDSVDKTYEYDGNSYSIDINLVFPTNGVTIEYSTDPDSIVDGVKDETANWTTALPTITNTGSANIYWWASANDYNSKSGYNTITITKAGNYFLSGGVMIESINKGDTLNPYAEAKFGTPYYKYSSSYNGTYTTTEPTEAGLYYVKAYVDETSNYDGLESEAVAFYIEDPTIYTLGINSWDKINTLGAPQITNVTISSDQKASVLMNFNYIPDKANSNYIKFVFPENLSVGTTLTLIDFSDNENTYIYYYTVTSATDTVASNEFKKMGTNITETFEKGTDTIQTNVLYQLVIDYNTMPSISGDLTVVKNTGGSDLSLISPIRINTNSNATGSYTTPTINMSENNHKVTINTTLSNLSSEASFSNVLFVMLYENNGTTKKVFSPNTVVKINGTNAYINGNMAALGNISNGANNITIEGLEAGSYKVKIGIANTRNNSFDISFPRNNIIGSISSLVSFTIDEYPSYALKVSTSTKEERVVDTTDESKNIDLNIRYKAINTITSPYITMVVKKKGNNGTYDTTINGWTFVLSNSITDTTNSTNQVEDTVMTVTIPEGSSEGFYRLYLTIGDYTYFFNVAVFSGELSNVVVNPSAFE